MSSSNVVLGTGFPDGGSSKVSFLYYVRAERQNSLCTYASSRGKRQAIGKVQGLWDRLSIHLNSGLFMSANKVQTRLNQLLVKAIKLFP